MFCFLEIAVASPVNMFYYINRWCKPTDRPIECQFSRTKASSRNTRYYFIFRYKLTDANPLPFLFLPEIVNKASRKRLFVDEPIFCQGKLSDVQLDDYLERAKAMKKFVRGSDIWYKSHNNGSAKLQQGRVVETPRTGESVNVVPFCGGLLGSVFTKDWDDIVETSHMHLIEHLHSCGYDVESALRSIPHPKPPLNLEEKETADAFIASRYSHVFIMWSCLQIISCFSSTGREGQLLCSSFGKNCLRRGQGKLSNTSYHNT